MDVCHLIEYSWSTESRLCYAESEEGYRQELVQARKSAKNRSDESTCTQTRSIDTKRDEKQCECFLKQKERTVPTWRIMMMARWSRNEWRKEDNRRPESALIEPKTCFTLRLFRTNIGPFQENLRFWIRPTSLIQERIEINNCSPKVYDRVPSSNSHAFQIDPLPECWCLRIKTIGNAQSGKIENQKVPLKNRSSKNRPSNTQTNEPI